jgi:hypothetical protein
MEMTLTEHENELLRGFLCDSLPALQREIARTEQHELRHTLVERQDLIERLLEALGPNVP